MRNLAATPLPFVYLAAVELRASPLRAMLWTLSMRPLAPSLSLALALTLAATSCGPAGGASGDAATDARPMLPLPAVQGLVEIEDTNPDPRVVEVNLTAAETDVELVAGRMTRAMTYNGRVPGPLLHARVGDRVIDLMVGVTYPAKFQVERAVGGGGWAGSGAGINMMADPFFTPIVGPAALFNCYAAYGWAASSYWGNCSGYDPRMYAMFPGYYNGYWGAFGPDWVVTQPGIGGGVPVQPQPEGRVVNGRGYTQVRPIETTFSMPGDGGSNGTTSTGNTSSGTSSGSSGVSGSGYSGGFSGGGGDRTAVPRGPGGR